MTHPLLTYSSSARLMTSLNGSPRFAATSWAACQRSSGTLTLLAFPPTPICLNLLAEGFVEVELESDAIQPNYRPSDLHPVSHDQPPVRVLTYVNPLAARDATKSGDLVGASW